MKAFYVVLYPGPSYWRHFLVFEETPEKAVHKLNYQARLALPIIQESYPNNEYGRVKRLKAIIRTSRRYKRMHLPRFGSNSQGQPFCVVNEIPQSVVHEGQICFGVHTEYILLNLLPDLLKPKVGNE